MQEFWFDYVKTKYEGKVNLYNVDTDTFIFYIKTEDTYIDITKMSKEDLILQVMNQEYH